MRHILTLLVILVLTSACGARAQPAASPPLPAPTDQPAPAVPPITLATPAALIRSASGDPFEGAAVGGVAVLFPVDSGRPFAGTRYTAPVGTSDQIITGLTPNAGYTVTVNAGVGGRGRERNAGGDDHVRLRRSGSDCDSKRKLTAVEHLTLPPASCSA